MKDWGRKVLRLLAREREGGDKYACRSFPPVVVLVEGGGMAGDGRRFR